MTRTLRFKCHLLSDFELNFETFCALVYYCICGTEIRVNLLACGTHKALALRVARDHDSITGS